MLLFAPILFISQNFQPSSFAQYWSASSSQWHQVCIGSLSPQLSLDLPSNIQCENNQLPPDLVQKTELINLYQCKTSPLIVNITEVQYQKGIQPDFNKGIQGSLNFVNALESALNTKYQTFPVKTNGLKGLLLKISFQTENQPYEIDQLMYIDGQNYWQVQVMYYSDGPTACQSADRVLHSVKFKSHPSS